MGDMTDFEEDAYLNYRFKGGAMTQLTTAYIGLFTLSPGETGGGTEVVGNGYARLAMAQADWDAVVAGEPSTIDNAVDKLFAQAVGGNWGTIVAAGVFDASTAGNLLYLKVLGTSKIISDGDQGKFNGGDLKIGVG